MKEFIENSGLTAAQFAKKYDIPYNTVRQWAEGIRKAPGWLKRLFESEQAYKPLIKEINKTIYYAASANWTHGTEYLYLFREEKTRDNWLKKYEKAGYDCNKINLIEIKSLKETKK